MCALRIQRLARMRMIPRTINDIASSTSEITRNIQKKNRRNVPAATTPHVNAESAA